MHYTPAPPPPADWRDAPLTPGDWAYRGDPASSEAVFAGGAFVLRCEPQARTIHLSRQGATVGAPLTVRTTYGARAVTGTLAATDPLFDQIAFSRGRFTVEAAGLPTLIVPAWAEPARVIEDCRG